MTRSFIGRVPVALSDGDDFGDVASSNCEPLCATLLRYESSDCSSFVLPVSQFASSLSHADRIGGGNQWC